MQKDGQLVEAEASVTSYVVYESLDELILSHQWFQDHVRGPMEQHLEATVQAMQLGECFVRLHPLEIEQGLECPDVLLGEETTLDWQEVVHHVAS